MYIYDRLIRIGKEYLGLWIYIIIKCMCTRFLCKKCNLCQRVAYICLDIRAYVRMCVCARITVLPLIKPQNRISKRVCVVSAYVHVSA